MPDKQTTIIIHALRSLKSLDQKGYWDNERHCGSDFDSVGECNLCQHHDACNIAESLDKDLLALDNLAGG